MPASTGYVARETGSNLGRNPIMTLAAVVVMAVALTAVAAVLLMRQEVNKASIQWRGGVEVAIFMNPNASAGQTAAIGHELEATPGVKSVRYVNQQGAYSEFRTMFAAEPELVSVVTPTDLPPSYRIVPVNPASVEALGNQFKNAPGVSTVQYAQKEIDALISSFNDKRNVLYVLALAVMVGATALIVNTIQLAIFARRREVAVMKLVGATNWFIRLPFMIEGLIQGLLGGLVASVAGFYIRNHLSSFANLQLVSNQRQLFATSGEAIATGIVVLVVGAAVGALGSAFAVRRFLAV
ncbi:MAG: cell division protein FtsX [Acidimicrobiales bacterium]